MDKIKKLDIIKDVIDLMWTRRLRGNYIRKAQELVVGELKARYANFNIISPLCACLLCVYMFSSTFSNLKCY